MLCFAYGSNLSPPRLASRVPSARVVAVAALARHRLQFHKIGMDGSGKCDAVPTGLECDEVLGAVYDIRDADKRMLDRIEGLGNGYQEVEVEVRCADGAITARMYRATAIDPGRLPFSWYRTHVIVGARAHGLPEAYIERIESVPALVDDDRHRHARELSVYAG